MDIPAARLVAWYRDYGIPQRRQGGESSEEYELATALRNCRSYHKQGRMLAGVQYLKAHAPELLLSDSEFKAHELVAFSVGKNGGRLPNNLPISNTEEYKKHSRFLRTLRDSAKNSGHKNDKAFEIVAKEFPHWQHPHDHPPLPKRPRNEDTVEVRIMKS